MAIFTPQSTTNPGRGDELISTFKSGRARTKRFLHRPTGAPFHPVESSRRSGLSAGRAAGRVPPGSRAGSTGRPGGFHRCATVTRLIISGRIDMGDGGAAGGSSHGFIISMLINFMVASYQYMMYQFCVHNICIVCVSECVCVCVCVCVLNS